MNLRQLHRAIAQQKQLIENTAAAADAMDDKADSLPHPNDRRAAAKTARDIRKRLYDLIPELHRLEALTPEARATPAAPPQALSFSHDDTPFLPAEQRHLWDAQTEALNSDQIAA